MLRPAPKVNYTGSRALGWLRLLRSFVLFWVGFTRTVRPALKGGTLVVGDRWAYSYLVQPGPLRFRGPKWLAAWAIRALPQPDLVVNLTATVEVILERKRELSPEEVAAELVAWSSLPLPQLLTLDASRDVVDIVADIEAALRK
jgi:thymidylate kinase